MKDWEITEAYFLPRIINWRTGNTLPGRPPKSNLRFFSLSEDNQWTAWKSSDYFYPEMIPEPDYSDSGEEAVSEDENSFLSAPDPRSATERLRDMTEVYVSNENTTKNVTQPKTAPGKQAAPSSKATPKTRPRSPTKPTEKSKSKSPSRDKTPKGPPSTVKKKTESPEGKRKADAEKSSTIQEVTKDRPSATRPATTEKPKTKPVAAKTKPAPAKTKPASAKTKSAAAPEKKTPPKTPTKTKTTSAKAAPASTKKGTGDRKSKTTSGHTDNGPLSPQSSDPSATSETSSDEDQLIKPRKPYMPSTEEQKLHKELKFSQKYGRLSSSKTELQMALERYTENKVRRELDAEAKTSLEKILEYQAKKIEMQEAMDKCPAWMQHLQRPPPAWPNPKTEEFYRVHARVVSNNILTHCFLPDDEPCENSLSKTFRHSESSGDSSSTEYF